MLLLLVRCQILYFHGHRKVGSVRHNCGHPALAIAELSSVSVNVSETTGRHRSSVLVTVVAQSCLQRFAIVTGHHRRVTVACSQCQSSATGCRIADQLTQQLNRTSQFHQRSTCVCHHVTLRRLSVDLKAKHDDLSRLTSAGSA